MTLTSGKIKSYEECTFFICMCRVWLKLSSRSFSISGFTLRLNKIKLHFEFIFLYSMIDIFLISSFYIWIYSFHSTNYGRCCLFSSVYFWYYNQISDGCDCVYLCFGSSILFHWSILSLNQGHDIFIITPVWYILKSRIIIFPTFFFLFRINLAICVICDYIWILYFFSTSVKNFVGILSGVVLNH